MSDDRFPKFKMSDRVRAWAAKRPGPEIRPSGVAPPCVDCTGQVVLPEAPPAGDESIEEPE